MRIELSLALSALVLCAASGGSLAEAGTGPLARSTPEQQGVSSAAIQDFISTANTKLDSLHSFMLIRHGHVVAEGWWSPYNAKSRHELYSLSKSFTSTAVGLAIAEGKLELSDSVLSTFSQDAPSEPSEFLKAMRLGDLLRMSAGQQKESPSPANVMTPKTFLAQPVPFKPGTHFLYNTPATFMASAMVQKATNQTVLDFLKPRLFEPLGIEDPTWDTNSQGISLGGYGLSLRTEDIAKFGQLYLQRGSWAGKQLLPAKWVDEATARQTSNGSNPKSDWEQGYGYQFWRCRNGAYRCDGAFGQYCLVMPEQDAVIAITSGLKDMQAVLNLVWEKLLPAMQSAPLPPEKDMHDLLLKTLNQLTIKPPQGAATSSRMSEVSGKTYSFPANDRNLETVCVDASADKPTLTLHLKFDGKESTIACDSDTWTKGVSNLPILGSKPVAARAAWVDPDTLQVRVVLYETPFINTFTLQFKDKEILYTSESNIRGKEPRLTGKLH